MFEWAGGWLDGWVFGFMDREIGDGWMAGKIE